MNRFSGLLESFLPEALLLALLALLLFCNANMFAIDPYSELFHITAAKESVSAGHFWIPVLNGHEYLIRAPLWTWIVTLSFKLFGASLWAARIPAMFCGLLGLALTGLLTRTLTGSRLASCFSAVVLGTTWGFLHLSALSTADTLAMDFYLGFFCAFLGWVMVAEKRHSVQWESDLFCLIMGVLAGFLLLLKSPLSLVVLLALALVYLALNRNLALLRKLSIAPFFAPMLLIPFPWLLGASIASHQLLFIYDYMLAYPVARMFAMGFWQGLRADPWFYLKALPLDLLPYTPILPAMMLEDAVTQGMAQQKATSTQRRTHVTPSVSGPWVLWILVWSVGGLLVYSCSAFQEPTAMLPFYPPLAIIVGVYLARVLTSEAGTGRPYRDMTSLMILSLMLGAVLLAILVFQVLPANYVEGFWHLPGKPTLDFLQISDHRIDLLEPFPIWKLWIIPGPFILLAGGLTLFALQASRRMALTAPAMVGTFLAFLLFIKLIVLPVLCRPVPLAAAQEINRRIRPGDEVVLASLHPDVKRVWFYLKRQKGISIRFIREPDRLSQDLPRERGALFGVMREKSYFQDLDYASRDQLRILNYNWSWDARRRSELLKLFIMRPPLFNRMKSGLITFYSLPPIRWDEEFPASSQTKNRK